MMDNNDDLKMLWGAQQTVAAPDVSVLLAQASKVKNKMRNKLIRGNVILVLTAIFVGWVWMHYQPQMITTKVGIVMVIAAIAMYVISSTSSLQFLFKGNVGIDTSQYLSQMLVLRHKQEFLQKTMITLYFILLSAGIGLYMIEYAMMMGWRGGITAYAITGAWIAFNWFYTRPRTARKQMASLNEVIAKLEEINKQLRD
jgi:hypothetical protein